MRAKTALASIGCRQTLSENALRTHKDEASLCISDAIGLREYCDLRDAEDIVVDLTKSSPAEVYATKVLE